jgi:hypothetical protein
MTAITSCIRRAICVKSTGGRVHFRQPESIGVFHLVVNVGRTDQGLAGHTAIVQAVSAEGGLLFDQQGLGAQLRRARSDGKTGRAAADDADIVVVVAIVVSFRFR